MIDVLLSGIVVGVSAFVLTFFMQSLDGPFDVFWKLRRHFSELDVYDQPFHPFMHGLYACYYCMATWICAIVTVLYSVLVPISLFHALPVCIMGIGVASIINMAIVER